jgi:hypothetical protein
VIQRRALAFSILFGMAAFGLASCGSDSTPSPVGPTPTPTPLPTPTTTPTLACNPAPPALYGFRLSVRESSGYRKVLAAKPLVANVDGYCGKVGFDPNQGFCATRPDGDPLLSACDAAAVGRAKDTGRPGPTWFYEGGPCTGNTAEQGCENHPSDQFLVIAKGAGEFAACAADAIAVDPDGSRCGVLSVPPLP